ncbi:MAG: hypothetical protein DHS20C21_09080 [Gemmatimonadota bacterium]|nr:MAG: hypothetical protein DHS20C21_09080 [Gemmatimonadota bacterium]
MSKKKLLLRISPEVWEDIRRWADDELRSVNGHIEFLLRQALREQGRAKKKPPGPEDRGASPPVE